MLAPSQIIGGGGGLAHGILKIALKCDSRLWVNFHGFPLLSTFLHREHLP